ncbi:ribonuclease YeeF family protein [Bacillus haynesii]|uniref:ribonuclease YeeF family protein n=1 Tax=Bacillus haynesii TaxID=1925021 RepID=UPI00228080B0|nr:T7SS effector LXG polymorphic toxin [Bacillus haynesii]MCY7789835.1 T7SS effector LXG polymorphic toxin [Bacillus haynesii]MCY8076693.1 T7SS effector LXG polymorphic toxin [Bacillus haynesii]
MKVFEASSLIEAANKRKKEYEAFEDQLQTLKKAFLGVADLGDDFQGKGADNIKDFFRGQAEIVDSWLKLVDAQIAFFKGVSGDIKDQKLSNSYVEVSFLDHELKNADLKATEIVSGLKLEMDKIIASVSDIVDLDNWTLDDYIDKMGKAQETRQNTIDAVNKLDESLKTEYSNLEALDNAVLAKYSGLMEATSHGKSAAPMHFSLKSFHSSEIYKNTMEVEKQATNYIDFKSEQAEARRLQEKQEEEANKPWYLKALDAGGTFLGEISGYYDYKRAAEGVDPVTGEKLTDGQRVAAGAMGAAGYIPVVGWLGKGAKGIKGVYSMYKAEKAVTTVDKALAAYKTPKTFHALKNSEKGLYGLAAANGFSETITGRDMLGNKISDEQRQDSLNRAFAMIAPFGMQKAGKVLNINSHNGKATNLYRGEDLPYEPKRPNGIGKSHISPETGNLVPANKTGMYQGRQVTVTEHVLGGYRKGGKSNSPYTSFTINQKVAKGYGENTIELDISALRKAIRSGEVKDIVILSPKQIERLIKNDTRQSEHWKNKALKWTQRDTEYFVKGEVPKQFIKLHPKE